MPNFMQNTVTLEPVAFEPTAFSPNADLTDANLAAPVRWAVTVRTAAPRTSTPWRRSLARHGGTAAVIALMLTCAAYGIYALLFLTGF